MADRLGFVGLGNMGRPMASCLAKAGANPLLWARNPASAEEVVALGGELAPDVGTLFAQCGCVISMLADGPSMDAVFGRGTPDFAERLEGRLLVHMGTTPPDYSLGLARDIEAVGGRYLEMPVSGSSVPAARGELVAMAAGDPADIAEAEPLVAPMVTSVIRCGVVPQAMQMKLAVNAYLGGVLLGLFEAVDFAKRCDLDMQTLNAILDAGPMSNDLMRMKMVKLLADDHAPQGSVRQAINNWGMISDAGQSVSAQMYGSRVLRDLCKAAAAEGFLDEDITSVVKVLGKA